MPIQAEPDGTLDVENATLRSRNIVSLTNMVAGNDVVRSTAAPTLEVYGDPSHGGTEPTLELVSNVGAAGSAFTRLTSNAGVFTIQSGTAGTADSKGDIAFSSVGGSTERMRIQGSTGRVGIGAASPTAKLEVHNSGTAASIGDLVADFTGSWMRIGDARTARTFSAGTGIKFHDSGISHYSVGQLDGKFKISITSNTGDELFPSAGYTEGINMDTSGNVGIGKTNPIYPLDVNGSVKINNRLVGPGQSNLYFDPNNEPKLYSAASTQFLFATNGYAYATAWIDTSDRRLKKNIEPLNNALDTLKKLNPVHYEKRSTETMVCDEECKEEKCYHHEDGFIAQEVQEIPELAHAVSHPESTDMLGLKYNSILAYCVKAVQEQQTIIETEKARNDALEARIAALESA